MADPTQALTLQLLEWIASEPRTYADVLDAWRTTCPRLSIWEDACIDGLIECASRADVVAVSAKGLALLQSQVASVPTIKERVDLGLRRGARPPT